MFGFQSLKKDVDSWPQKYSQFRSGTEAIRNAAAAATVAVEETANPVARLAARQRAVTATRRQEQRRRARAVEQEREPKVLSSWTRRFKTNSSPSNRVLLPRPLAPIENEAFLVSGSLSLGLAQGGQPDSGPDMRFLGGANRKRQPDRAGIRRNSSRAKRRWGTWGRRRIWRRARRIWRARRWWGRGGRGGFGGPGRCPGQTAGAQFGNFRRRNQQIHGQLSFTLQNSAVNAKPFSINGLDIPQAAYAQSRFSAIVGGPLVIKKLIKDPGTQFFLSSSVPAPATPCYFPKPSQLLPSVWGTSPSHPIARHQCHQRPGPDFRPNHSTSRSWET